MTECNLFNYKNNNDSCLLNTVSVMSAPALYLWWLLLHSAERVAVAPSRVPTADIPTLPEVPGVSRILIAASACPQMIYNLPESRVSEQERAR